jgi:hypothetical protein
MHITTILIIILLAITLLGSIGYDVINSNYDVNTLLTYLFILLFTIILIVDQECIISSGLDILSSSNTGTKCNIWAWIKFLIILAAIFLYLVIRFKFFVKSKILDKKDEKEDESKQ